MLPVYVGVYLRASVRPFAVGSSDAKTAYTLLYEVCAVAPLSAEDAYGGFRCATPLRMLHGGGSTTTVFCGSLPTLRPTQSLGLRNSTEKWCAWHGGDACPR